MANQPLQIDWKEALMLVIDGVGEAEGVCFQNFWCMSEEMKQEIMKTYEQWLINQKGHKDVLK